jgi:general secretion pathway protein D
MSKYNRARKKTTEIAETAGQRRTGMAALIAVALALCLTLPAAQRSYAQDPAANQASLNFVGADIESVVKAIGHYTNTTFLIDPRVKGSINLVSEKPVTKAQAFEMLTSALRLQGYTVVVGDGFTKVVPEADAKLQAGPIQGGKVRGDQIATQIFHLNYETAANMVPVLRPLISPNNTINANPGSNSIVITDYADNLRRLGRIIAALDSPATADMDVVPIRHALASDIAVMVNRLLDTGAPGSSADAGRVNLLADPRSNSVIIRAPSVARANLAKSLINKLDLPTAMPGNVHVVYLKNAEATRLAQTLRAVVASDSSIIAPSNTQSQPSQQNTLNTGQQQNPGTTLFARAAAGAAADRRAGWIYPGRQRDQLAHHHRQRTGLSQFARGDRPARRASRASLCRIADRGSVCHARGGIRHPVGQLVGRCRQSVPGRHHHGFFERWQ